MRRVIKFGGTSIASPELLREGARHVARLVEYGEQIAVVVSAPGNLTSELLGAIYAVADGTAAHQPETLSFADTCAFLALGEEQSVHLMTAALRSYGLSARGFLPRETDTWPIIADVEDVSPLATAKINEERPFKLRTQQTVSRFSRFVLPELRVGTVPVISGFFAVDSAGKVVALGRGGSDITAFIVASQISADEVVIVTDVRGVLSADPRLAENPRLLEQLAAADLEMIAGAGARVLHPRALKFKTEYMGVRLMDYRELDKLEESGTSVLGKSETTLYRNPVELSMLTVMGKRGEPSKLPGAVMEWVSRHEIDLAGSSSNDRFTCLYLPSSEADKVYSGLHAALYGDFADLTNLSLRGGLGEIRLRSARFIDEPGVLAEITGMLANARIPVAELLTGLTDISVFIPFTELDRAEVLLRRVLDSFPG